MCLLPYQVGDYVRFIVTSNDKASREMLRSMRLEVDTGIKAGGKKGSQSGDDAGKSACLLVLPPETEIEQTASCCDPTA